MLVTEVEGRDCCAKLHYPWRGLGEVLGVSRVVPGRDEKRRLKISICLSIVRRQVEYINVSNIDPGITDRILTPALMRNGWREREYYFRNLNVQPTAHHHMPQATVQHKALAVQEVESTS